MGLNLMRSGCLFAVVYMTHLDATLGERDKFENRILNVTSILEPPWLMVKRGAPDGQPLVGNDRFEGYIADVLALLANTASFDYKISLVADGKYGAIGQDGHWNGMIGELVRREADIAAAPLTVTSIRARVVDFVHPFHKLGLTMLVKRPPAQPDVGLVINFHKAFTWSTWALVGCCILLSCVLVRLLSAYHPCEWTKLHDQGGDVEYEQQSFSSAGVVWFVLASLVGQGSTVAPRSIGGRCLAATWYIFAMFVALLFLASIVAQVSALYANDLNSQVPKHKLQSFDDLANFKEDYKIGVIQGGSTREYFKTSQFATNARIWEAIENNPENLVRRTDEGVQRASEERDYVMILESTTGDYIKNRQCDLMTVGHTTGKSYGLALPLGNDMMLKSLNEAILEMNENGELEKIYRKWMTGRGTCWRHDDEHQEHKYAQMSFRDADALGFGIREAACAFYVLLSAVLLAILLCILEVFVLPLFRKAN